MTCQKIGHAIVCGPKIYDYSGWLFEVHSYLGPWPLRRSDHSPMARAGQKFWEMNERGQGVEDKEAYRLKDDGRE